MQPSLARQCVRVYEDGEGAIALAKNPLSSVRTTHIHAIFHFLSQLVAKQQTSVGHVGSEDQHVDVLTKPWASESFSCRIDFWINL